MKKLFAGVGIVALFGCGSGQHMTQTASDTECAVSCQQYKDSQGASWPYEYDPKGTCSCINPDYQPN